MLIVVFVQTKMLYGKQIQNYMGDALLKKISTRVKSKAISVICEKKNKISTCMEVCIFKITGILPISKVKQIMKETKGSANPQIAMNLLQEELK